MNFISQCYRCGICNNWIEHRLVPCPDEQSGPGCLVAHFGYVCTTCNIQKNLPFEFDLSKIKFKEEPGIFVFNFEALKRLEKFTYWRK